jgi:putative endonuclease
MTKTSREAGQRGEQIARTILKGKGFRIEACNWRAGRLGEIDLVVYHPEQRVLAFVEVKTRRSVSCGFPIEAIDAGKQAKLTALAETYLSQNPTGPDVSIRFDVVVIYFSHPAKPADIQHIENAFDAV